MTSIMPTHNLGQLIKSINSHSSFLLSAHVSPEGDCVASLIAMDSLLQKIRKKSFILCEDPVPLQLSFLDNGRWHTLKSGNESPDFDAGIIVDCPTLDRIGRVQDVIRSKKTFTINIDHHVSNRSFGDVNFVDVHAAACGELIYALFKELKIPLSEEDCRAIYVSISTDTGSFRYSNTSAKTHEIVADLMRHGLNIEQINESLYENIPKRKVDLFKIFLNRIEFNDEMKSACAILKEGDFEKEGASKTDLEGFVEYLRSIHGVEVAFFITEQEGDSRVSFRSKGHFDVNLLAGHFGGGGHKKASGCTIHEAPELAKKKILDQIRVQRKGN